MITPSICFYTPSVSYMPVILTITQRQSDTFAYRYALFIHHLTNKTSIYRLCELD